jgi:hypothetical protein
MATINRSAFILRPREPFVHWATSVDADAANAALAAHASVYLVPEDANGEFEAPALEEYFEEMFELELSDWTEDETRWPARRDFELFLEWFDVQGEPVTDLGRGQILIEDEEMRTVRTARDDEDEIEDDEEFDEEDLDDEDDEVLGRDDAH